MGFEIYEERLVARDGKVEPQRTQYHHALVYSDHGGLLEVRSGGYGGMEETLVFKVREPSEDDDVTVTRAAFNDAVDALRRLRGMDTPTPELEDVRERAATVVERACDMLQGGGDVGQTAASDLRATMLQLIDLATSRGESKPELASGESTA